MASIVFIVPYFGYFPKTFPVWLKSVSYNPDIDVLIITDDKRSFDYPSNVRVVYMSFEECRSLFQSKYDFPLALDRPYKLCDFKPTYGYVFSEYIKDYEFWAFGDIDTIWGNLRSFITDDLLSRYDRLFDLGHFALTRNTEQCNHVYEQKVEGLLYYKDVLSTPQSMYFDECHMGTGSTYIWDSIHKDRFYKERPFDDISPCRYNRHNFWISNHHDKSKHVIYKFVKGRLYRLYIDGLLQIEEESMYIHLMQRGMSIETKSLDEFWIVPNKLIDYYEQMPLWKHWILGRKRYMRDAFGTIYHFLQVGFHTYMQKHHETKN